MQGLSGVPCVSEHVPVFAEGVLGNAWVDCSLPNSLWSSRHPPRGRMGQLATLINLKVPQASPVFVTTSGELLDCNPSILLRPGLAGNSSDSTSYSVSPSFRPPSVELGKPFTVSHTLISTD